MARNRSAGVPYLERLSTFECLKEYNTQYLSSRGDVLVVQAEVVSPLLVFNESWSHIDSTGHYLGEGTAADVDVSNSFRAGIPERLISIYKVLPSQSQPSDYPSHKWQCNPVESDQTCVPPEVSPQVPWSPFGSPVHYCLSENVPERCQLNWSLQFAIIVVVSNLAKVVCMFLTLWRHDIPALITIGDAIQSFLDRPDPYTRGCCVYSDHLIQLLMQWEADVPVVMPFSSSATVLNHTRDKFLKDPKSRQWRPPRRRWWSAVPIFRWVLCIFL